MLKILLARLRQGHRTAKFPDAEPALADRFRGKPLIDPSMCPEGCRACIDACPTGAISSSGGLVLDLGKCLFCTDCSDACPEGAIEYTGEYRLATRSRLDLVLSATAKRARDLRLAAELLRVFGRSLKLRVVSAGGCNGCESDVNVLGTLVFDLGRFGIQFVASPRHADGILVTGPVTANMKLALEKTYAAVPAPRIVIAVGACAISGGPYIGHPEVGGGAESVVPVDLYVPGCPPHPYTILEGLLGLLGRAGARHRPADDDSSAGETEDEARRWGAERAEDAMNTLGVDLGGTPGGGEGRDP
jgi:Ni,Fe-hydrogenase III small subunit/NAD-dependent dihydropyrimidine dehydrogenase PreA subunit